MRSSIPLSDAALEHLAGGASNVQIDPELGPGRRPPGSAPVFSPRALRDQPGRGSLLGRFVEDGVAQRLQDLGAHRLVLWGLQRAVQGGFPPTATQAFVGRTPAGWPVPPAWAVHVTPDEELRVNSPVQGRY